MTLMSRFRFRAFPSALALVLAASAYLGFAGPASAAIEAGTENATQGARLAEPSAMAATQSVSVVVSRFVKRGCEARFEQAWRDMIPVRSAFPGHLGSDIIKPVGTGDASYHMVYRFDSDQHLLAWQLSPERAAWLQRLDALTLGTPQYRYETGLGAWVALPERQGAVPEKYKTTVVTWLAIFPLVAGIATVTPVVTTPLFGPLPFLANTAIVTGLVVPALSYVVMPPMTWLFRDWLYPSDPACAVAD